MRFFTMYLTVFWLLVLTGGVHAVQEQPGERAYTIIVVFSDFSVHVFDPDATEIFVSAVALPKYTPKLPVKGKLTGIERNPWWFPPPGVKAYVLKHDNIVLPDRVSPGPNNPMGPVKFIFAFSTPGAQPLSRMHGTTSPRSIGKRATFGCIRMYNEEASALADIIQPLFKDGAVFNVEYVESLIPHYEKLVSR